MIEDEWRDEKKKNKKKDDELKFSKHRSLHVFDWTRHRTRDKQRLDWLTNRDSSIDDSLQMRTWWIIWWNFLILDDKSLNLLFSRKEKKSWCYHLKRCYNSNMNLLMMMCILDEIFERDFAIIYWDSFFWEETFLNSSDNTIILLRNIMCQIHWHQQKMKKSLINFEIHISSKIHIFHRFLSQFVNIDKNRKKFSIQKSTRL